MIDVVDRVTKEIDRKEKNVGGVFKCEYFQLSDMAVCSS